MTASSRGNVRQGRSLLAFALVFVVAGCGTSERTAPSPSSTTAPTSTTATAAGTSRRPVTTTAKEAGTSTPTVAPTVPAVIVRHGDERRRWIALTFDAGSDTGNTTTILDLLAARHVHATFALTGAWARANPELVRRVALDGHVIVNHTDTHESFTGVSTPTPALSAADRAAQLERADTSIAAITGTSTRPWFRPPYGDIDAATPVDVARAGYRYILMWTVDSLGWEGLAPYDVAARCLNGATPGGILLLHVGSLSTDAAALPRILDGLRARGYKLVTIAAAGFITG